MAQLGQISKNNAYTAELHQMFIKDKLGQISYNFFVTGPSLYIV